MKYSKQISEDMGQKKTPETLSQTGGDRLTKTADFGKLSIKKNVSGDIKGVIEIYGEKLEVVPTCKEDVASFTE